MKEKTLAEVRRQAIAATLFRPTTLKHAIDTLGFVQCDPIRAPARAQDLILRQRVEGYRARDLERLYPELGVEEDYVYAYGVVSEDTWRLLHPRASVRITKREEMVRQLVCARERTHPRDLETHFGRKREVNAWGSYSKQTTHALQSLHYQGLLRVAGREKGIRLYQAARAQEMFLAPDERLRRLILLIVRILAPMPEKSLRATLLHLAHAAPNLTGRQKALKGLFKTGALETGDVEGVRYVWAPGEWSGQEPPAAVRFLAPFDPLVWDRYRFEHLWNWPYRFEAYTPPAKRKMGYYALPLLWGEQIVGWVNVGLDQGRVLVDAGFVEERPTGAKFRRAFEAEVERMKAFLVPRTG